MPYERYVADEVFARAGMASTGFPRSDQPAPVLSNLDPPTGEELGTAIARALR